MKFTFLLSLPLLVGLNGCMGTPEAPVSKEHLAKEAIQENKTEAQNAQDAYERLQAQRSRE